jgi:hypothetical protein
VSEHRRPYHSAEEVFGITDREKLWDKVSDIRFNAILQDPQTTIHEVTTSYNNYGEYLFVTVSRERDGQRRALTMWGLGYHESREQWITDHWRYHSTNMSFVTGKELTLEEAQRLIQERREEIQPYITDDPPSDRAMLFSLLAELVDEDGASVELEDLENLMGSHLFGDIPEDE